MPCDISWRRFPTRSSLGHFLGREQPQVETAFAGRVTPISELDNRRVQAIEELAVPIIAQYCFQV